MCACVCALARVRSLALTRCNRAAQLLLPVRRQPRLHQGGWGLPRRHRRVQGASWLATRLVPLVRARTRTYACSRRGVSARARVLPCPDASHAHRTRAPQAAGATVIGISNGSIDSHKQFQLENDLPFALLCDDNDEVREAYGVKPALFGALPGRETFVIAKDGTCVMAFNGAKRRAVHASPSLALFRQRQHCCSRFRSRADAAVTDASHCARRPLRLHGARGQGARGAAAGQRDGLRYFEVHNSVPPVMLQRASTKVVQIVSEQHSLADPVRLFPPSSSPHLLNCSLAPLLLPSPTFPPASAMRLLLRGSCRACLLTSGAGPREGSRDLGRAVTGAARVEQRWHWARATGRD